MRSWAATARTACSRVLPAHPSRSRPPSPQLDRHRPHYMLKEKKLGDALVLACGLEADGPVAATLRHWQAPGRKGAGDFARVLQEVGG